MQHRPEQATAANLAGRKHMGGGEFLSKAPAPFSFRVESPHAKDHWRPRDPGDQIRPEYAGTAVIIDAELYEVVEYRGDFKTPGAGSPGVDSTGPSHPALELAGPEPDTHIYLLAPWDDRHPLRGPSFEYSPQALRDERRAHKRAQQQDAIGARLDWYGVLTALLPSKDQLHLQETYGYNAVFWTRWSAVVWTILWFGMCVTLIGGLPFNASELLAFLISLAFLIEQFFRRGKTLVGQPCGSMLGLALRRLLPQHLRAPD